MKFLFRLLALAGLIWLTLALFWQARAASAATGENGDPSKIIVLFAAVILLGAVIGILIAFLLLPAFGEWAGNFFFSPNEQDTAREPHANAAAKMARGDYAGAIADYRAALARDPADTFALGEAARIFCEKLGDPASAAALLEAALGRDWPQDQAAFLANRLADVYWRHQGDAPRARAILSQILAAMPDTKHAASAARRLREMEGAPDAAQDALEEQPTRGRLPAPGEGSEAEE